MRKHFETRKKQEKGFILIMAYLLMTALSIFSLGLFSRGNVFLQNADRNKKKIMAFNAAEAGFDDAFYRVKNNQITSYPWSSGYVSLSSGNFEAGYSTTVTDLGSNVKRINVTGYSPVQSSTSQSIDARPITAYVQSTPPSAFSFGVFAKNSITMSGNAQIDSYNSHNGAYGGANVTQRGNIATDSTATGTVSLSGNVTVQGNATVGPNGNPSSVITTSGSATVTGTTQAATSLQNPQAASTSISSEGVLSISGNTTYNLTAGEHRFSSLSISGNGQLQPLGAVKIYVDGTVSISGNGIATVNNFPPNTLIYVTGSSGVSLSGNGSLYAGIYAPNSAVSNTGNGALYGAAVSNTYHQTGNGNVHFDEALKDAGGSGSNTLTVKSWQENNITAQSTTSSTTYTG